MDVESQVAPEDASLELPLSDLLDLLLQSPGLDGTSAALPPQFEVSDATASSADNQCTMPLDDVGAAVLSLPLREFCMNSLRLQSRCPGDAVAFFEYGRRVLGVELVCRGLKWRVELGFESITSIAPTAPPARAADVAAGEGDDATESDSSSGGGTVATANCTDVLVAFDRDAVFLRERCPQPRVVGPIPSLSFARSWIPTTDFTVDGHPLSNSGASRQLTLGFGPGVLPTEILAQCFHIFDTTSPSPAAMAAVSSAATSAVGSAFLEGESFSGPGNSADGVNASAAAAMSDAVNVANVPWPLEWHPQRGEMLDGANVAAGVLEEDDDDEGEGTRRSSSAVTKLHHVQDSHRRFRGVQRRGKKWAAVIWRDGAKAQRLGVFDTAHEAAQAYDTKARHLFGPRAALNFGPGGGAPLPNVRMAARLIGVESNGDTSATRSRLADHFFTASDVHTVDRGGAGSYYYGDDSGAETFPDDEEFIPIPGVASAAGRSASGMGGPKFRKSAGARPHGDRAFVESRGGLDSAAAGHSSRLTSRRRRVVSSSPSANELPQQQPRGTARGLGGMESTDIVSPPKGNKGNGGRSTTTKTTQQAVRAKAKQEAAKRQAEEYSNRSCKWCGRLGFANGKAYGGHVARCKQTAAKRRGGKVAETSVVQRPTQVAPQATRKRPRCSQTSDNGSGIRSQRNGSIAEPRHNPRTLRGGQETTLLDPLPTVPRRRKQVSAAAASGPGLVAASAGVQKRGNKLAKPWNPVWYPGHPCPICGRTDFKTGKGWGGHKAQCKKRQRLAAAAGNSLSMQAKSKMPQEAAAEVLENAVHAGEAANIGAKPKLAIASSSPVGAKSLQRSTTPAPEGISDPPSKTLLNGDHRCAMQEACQDDARSPSVQSNSTHSQSVCDALSADAGPLLMASAINKTTVQQKPISVSVPQEPSSQFAYDGAEERAPVTSAVGSGDSLSTTAALEPLAIDVVELQSPSNRTYAFLLHAHAVGDLSWCVTRVFPRLSRTGIEYTNAELDGLHGALSSPRNEPLALETADAANEGDAGSKLSLVTIGGSHVARQLKETYMDGRGSVASKAGGMCEDMPATSSS